MIKYTLFKTPINCDYSQVTQNIIRYAYKELKKDMRPTNIIEREFPEEIQGRLPSLYLWNEKRYLLGGEDVIQWMEETLKYPNLRDIATEWCEVNRMMNDDQANSKGKLYEDELLDEVESE